MNRLLAALRWDAVLQARYRLYTISAFMVLIWGAGLGLLPASARADGAVVVPVFVVGNLLITTFYFMGGLVLLEKADGVLATLVVTPLRGTEYLLAKTFTLTALALAETLLIVALLFGTNVRWGWLLAGTALLGAFYALVGFAVVVRYEAINTFLMPSVVWVTALVLPLLAHLGLPSRWWFILHPVEPMLVLLRAAYTPTTTLDLAYGVLGSLAWTGAAFVAARHRFARFVVRMAAA